MRTENVTVDLQDATAIRVDETGMGMALAVGVRMEDGRVEELSEALLRQIFREELKRMRDGY